MGELGRDWLLVDTCFDQRLLVCVLAPVVVGIHIVGVKQCIALHLRLRACVDGGRVLLWSPSTSTTSPLWRRSATRYVGL
jgi:hypothetical protein